MMNTLALDQNLKELVKFMHRGASNHLVTLMSTKKLSSQLKLSQTLPYVLKIRFYFLNIKMASFPARIGYLSLEIEFEFNLRI